MKKENLNRDLLSARERILLTAHDLFYAEGIRATGIDKIIKQASVTKVTFYRHFPSKNELILAFLDYRHLSWINWFKEAIKRHGSTIEAVVPALLEWFDSEHFRGCAFINSVGELSAVLPEVSICAQQHKLDMAEIIENVLDETPQAKSIANAVAIAIDGAIIRAQIDRTPANAIEGLKLIINAVK
jgi:AcrR family transcriptional regulator